MNCQKVTRDGHRHGHWGARRTCPRFKEAARIANAAGGVVVSKPGTATATREELSAELERLADANSMHKATKVLTLAEAVAHRLDWAHRRMRVGFTNGCFDILHLGHVRLFEFARANCDRLIVGINTDASVQRLKGARRPINSGDDRAQLVAALASVDAVVLFDEDTPEILIEELYPDLLVKGADYRFDEIVGANIVRAKGGKVLLFDLVPRRSTTGLLERMAAAGAIT